MLLDRKVLLMSNLTFYDRERIEFYHNLKSISLRDIGKIIGRDVSVVSREITRHKPQFSPYNAELAQKAAERKAHLTNTKKLEKCHELKQYVTEQLQEDLSPEQISGRLKNHPPPELEKAQRKTICAETIYQYVYQNEDNPFLYKHLRRHKTKRQKQGQRKERTLAIPDRTSIHDRPKIIETKRRYGDFEADMLCGQKGHEAVSVHYERKSMFVALEKLATKEAEETSQAFSRTIENLPDDFTKSFTLDNGGENFKHTDIKNDYQIKTYFCDPFKAWQKGGVENLNGLIRQYIPKGIDMKKIDQIYLKKVQEKLNNRPRKSLGYLTPNEILSKVLNAKEITKCCIKF